MSDVKTRRAGRGVLFVIAGMLFASGIMRLGGGAGQAIAAGVESTLGAQEMPQDATMSCGDDDTIDAILSDLQTRETLLSEKEGALQDRLQALRVADAEISRKLEELELAETSLAATITSAEGAMESDLVGLTSVYENMKPKDASALFEEMAPEFAAGFLGQMRPDTAAAILSGLEPRTAYSISILLAGRNANVPTE